MQLKATEIFKLILGICSIVFFILTYVNFLFFPILGLACGISDLILIKKSSASTNANITTISFILSIIGIIVNIIPLLIYVTCTSILEISCNGAFKELPDLFASEPV